MNKNLIKLSLLLSLSILISQLNAQVTIGSNETPISGALLQMKNIDGITDGKANANKGLAMPRVELSQWSDLFPMFESKSAPGTANGDYNDASKKESVDQKHIGLMVYNFSKINGFCPGLHVWDGNRWIDLKNYQRPDITMIDGDGNVYNAMWLNPSSDHCDLSRGAYWTTSNMYSTKNRNGGAFSDPGYGEVSDEDKPRLNPALRFSAIRSTSVITISSKVDLISGTVPDYGVNPTSVIDRNIKNQSRLDYVREYGLLYNQSQARELCPTGWRLPNLSDWEMLIEAHGGAGATLGPRMRKNWGYYYLANTVAASTLWGEYETGPANPSGFDAVPSGYVNLPDPTDPTEIKIGLVGTYFWREEDGKAVFISYGALSKNSSSDSYNYNSVRCLKE